VGIFCFSNLFVDFLKNDFVFFFFFVARLVYLFTTNKEIVMIDGAESKKTDWRMVVVEGGISVGWLID